MPKSKKPRKNYKPKPVYNPFSRFTRGQETSIALKHYEMLDAIAKGEADAQTMFDFCHASYSWTQLVDKNDFEEVHMLNEAGDMLNSMVDRHKKTGRVGLTGPELQTARELCQWFDKKLEKAKPEQVIKAIQDSKHKLNKSLEVFCES